MVAITTVVPHYITDTTSPHNESATHIYTLLVSISPDLVTVHTNIFQIPPCYHMSKFTEVWNVYLMYKPAQKMIISQICLHCLMSAELNMECKEDDHI